MMRSGLSIAVGMIKPIMDATVSMKGFGICNVPMTLLLWVWAMDIHVDIHMDTDIFMALALALALALSLILRDIDIGMTVAMDKTTSKHGFCEGQAWISIIADCGHDSCWMSNATGISHTRARDSDFDGSCSCDNNRQVSTSFI